ncbi:MAG: hypothetical protein V1845_02630 [bacterium]
MDQPTKKLGLTLLLLILAIAVFFRFYKLDQIPPALYPDVAINGTDALNALQNDDFRIFYPANNGREGLFMNLIALSFSVFGASVWAIKVVAAMFGTLTVLGLYLMIKEMFKNGSKNGEYIALLSAFFIAVSFWHVNFSRIGFRAVMVPFFLVWSLYFLFKASNSTPIQEISTNDTKKNPLIPYFLFLVSGLLFGLGFHTYIAFRVAPLVLVPIFIFDMIKNWPRVKLGRWFIFAFGIILAVSPLAYYYLNNPADFMGRAGQVSIFASASPIKALFDATLKTLGQFVFRGDYNWRHNLSGAPQVFWPLIPFFLLGLAYSLIQIFKKQNYIQRSWALLSCHWSLVFLWGTMLLPSILTNEGLPHALRSIGAIPATFIFVGVGVYLAIDYLNSKLLKYEHLLFAYKYAAAGLFVLLLISIAGFSYYQYFIYWGEHPETEGAFTKKFVDEALYLKSLPSAVKKYVVVNENGTAVPYPDGIPMPAQTIMFLTQTSQPPVQVQYIKHNQLADLAQISDLSSPVVILPMKYDQEIFRQLWNMFPYSQTEIMEASGFAVLKINF